MININYYFGKIVMNREMFRQFKSGANTISRDCTFGCTLTLEIRVRVKVRVS